MLEIDDIHTYYGESYVLQGISLAVPDAAVVAVLGRNGVGKTTLTRSVMAFTPPRRGTIRFAGESLAGWPAYRVAAAGIGLVPQGRRIFPSLTVREHLEIGQRAPGKAAAGEGWSIAKLYELFPRLGERAETRAGSLSGGERQMLAISRALISNPALVVMDEPTEGLSPLIVVQVEALIRRLRESGVSVLLAEQNLAFALAVADHVYVMDKGRIVWDGTAPALAADAAVKQGYLGV